MQQYALAYGEEAASNGGVSRDKVLERIGSTGHRMMKVWPSAEAALDGIVRDGMLLAIGGFGLCGIPESLIQAVHRSGARELTIASNNAGVEGWGIGVLLEDRQVAKMISSYVGENAEFERQYLSGELEVEFCPQGTLAERMRAGGAGIPGFYTRTGVGTVVAEGKEHKDFDGVTYILERGLKADVALVKAWKADTLGNLVYRLTARNFNPNAAMCGAITVAEAEFVVEPGELRPDEIHTPGIFVQRVVHNPSPEKRIERRTVRTEG
ncbi:MAG: CoA transferase subunit A [Acidobacteriaceae bacterium]